MISVRNEFKHCWIIDCNPGKSDCSSNFQHQGCFFKMKNTCISLHAIYYLVLGYPDILDINTLLSSRQDDDNRTPTAVTGMFRSNSAILSKV